MRSSPNTSRVIKSRKIRWTGHVARMGRRKGANNVFMGKPEERKQLGRPKHRWEANIEIDLQELNRWGMAWIDLAQNRDG